MKTLHLLFSVFAYLVISNQLMSQVYLVKNGHTRHRFAQLELGMTQYQSGGGTAPSLLDNRIVQNQLGTTSVYAFFIGGTHFWGHADFALTIPLAKFGKGIIYGVDLQAKFFPLAIERNKVRPYIGISMNPLSYRFKNGPFISKTNFPLVGGLNYMWRNHQFELGVVYSYNNSFDYDVSRTQVAKAYLPKLIVGATYKYTLETTLSAEKGWQDGSSQLITDRLASKGKLDGFSLAIGPTSAFRTKYSSYLVDRYNFAGQHAYDVALELGAGYYWHKNDIHANLALKSFKSEVSAYGYSQKARLRSATIEVFKMLGDYHGFVPFIGPNLSYYNAETLDQDINTASEVNSFNGLRPGITFGWDIRPNRIQKFLLRTNLRYTPNLNINMKKGGKSNFDNLEFNFIQLVLYPRRIR